MNEQQGAERLGDGYLESCGGSGELLEHWRVLMESVEGLGDEERKRRMESVRRVIAEQGITYNVYGDPLGMERLWNLDMVPMLLGSAEWRNLERGLVQRATLLDGVLRDCYGEQRLLKEGYLPPALLFAQSDFLRPVHGIKPSNGRYLNVYAADVARSPDGQWWVISDRTQIPTGMGYALANRLVTARMLPEAFRESGVERLAGFYQKFQGAMRELVPVGRGGGRVVILTPGPYNETYFEQAYLARYLGYALVEGQDLTVKDGQVFLKTLSGLEPVDVILRRVDDAFCDPLELRSDSMLGVAGLLDAVRSGTVGVANMLGSGIVQSPAFRGFLPGLCRAVLGEELAMPSLATWWCGQESAERYVVEHLDDLDICSAFGGGREVRGKSAAEVREMIRFAPYRWVGQERMRLSVAPSWEGSGWVEKAVVLRVFLVGTRDGYVVMPGALARTGAGAVTTGVTMQDGGASKDTWVLSEGPVNEVTLLSGTTEMVELRRVGNNLPSRLADNFFWIGRYAERVDAAARIFRGALLRFTPENVDSEFLLMEPLLRAMEVQEQIPKGASARGRTAKELETDFLGALYDRGQSGSLRALADRLVQLAMLVRDRTSNDVWRVLSQIEKVTSEEDVTWSPGEAIALLNRVLMLVSSFKGIARENMTRAQGWRFLDMGIRIERALSLSTFMKYSLLSPEATMPGLLESVLEVADSTLTYRSRYSILPNLMAVYDLVLLDDTNPRSLMFQLESLSKHIRRLPRYRENGLPDAAERLLLECLTRVRLLDPRELSFMGDRLEETATARVLELTIRQLWSLSEVIDVMYFAHSKTSHVGA